MKLALIITGSAIMAGFVVATVKPKSAAAPTYHAADGGRYEVASALFDLSDPARERNIPVKAYFPANSAGPFPVIIFSHGLGGSRETYCYLGREWAAHGYVCLHLQHHGSDTAVWRDSPWGHKSVAMRDALMNSSNILDRALDISFALDRLTVLNCTEGPLRGRLNTNCVGVAGHSFGALTAMIIAGEQLFLPNGLLSHPDARIKAALAMSTPISPQAAQYLAHKMFAPVRIPTLHMTGARDDGANAGLPRAPFDSIQGRDSFLITFEEADQADFSGQRLLSFLDRKNAMVHELIKSSSVAFWDAYLKHDSAAKTWLASGGFKCLLGEQGIFEERLAAAN